METFLQSNEIKIPKSNKVQNPFKSSFARSLSYSNNYIENHHDASKSLDFEIDHHHEPCYESETENSNYCDKKLTSLDEDLVVGNFNESFNKSDEDKERQLWSKNKHHQQITDINISSDAEIIRLRKECQNLIEENRKLQAKLPSKISSLPYGSLQFECNGNGVENVVLQTKIETLQWQLRQVENSRQMYRAIMEEVARYLEKCHLNFELLQQRERDKVIERSKSIAHLAKCRVAELGTANDGRARSSTNLLSLNSSQPLKQKSGTLLSDISYSAFKDFTWRRTPKNKSTTLEIKPEKFRFQLDEGNTSLNVFESSRQSTCNEVDIDAEKLSKEAFRLSRTVQNFLNTHEPILSQTNSSTESDRQNVFQRSILEPQRNEFLFGFDRESHISLRSSDESSVQSSNSSNSNKEDEDPTILPNIANSKVSALPTKSLAKTKRLSTCHQTEDESGFSSMNSFHEIGLPLHSTMISNISASSDESHSETVKFKKSSLDLKDEVGLPIPQKPAPNHRRYESAPVAVSQSSKMKLLENDEKTMKVLWV